MSGKSLSFKEMRVNGRGYHHHRSLRLRNRVGSHVRAVSYPVDAVPGSSMMQYREIVNE